MFEAPFENGQIVNFFMFSMLSIVKLMPCKIKQAEKNHEHARN